MARTSYIRRDDKDFRFVLEQHAKLDVYSASSLKQQSAVDTQTYYPDSGLTILCSYSLKLRFSGEATNTIFIVFELCLTGTRTQICRTRGEHVNQYTTVVAYPTRGEHANHYTIDAVYPFWGRAR